MCPNIIALEDRIDRIRKRLGDQMPVRDVGRIVGEVMGSLDGDLCLDDLHFQDELRELLQYVEKTRADIVRLRPRHLSTQELPDASDQLEEVVCATEQAATRIMDVAEEIGTLATEVDGALARRLEQLSMKIFEASEFQDITGQRVGKVSTTLRTLEVRLAELAETAGDLEPPEEKVVAKRPEDMDNEDLLHGPQLAHEANDQEAIDALLASFD